MSDDVTSGTNHRHVLPFPIKPRPSPAPTAGGKFGVFPLGREDVIVTLTVYGTIIDLLESGNAEHRSALAQELRRAYGAFFL